jgi:outer membrane lipoprotein-sorting protein
MRRIVLSLIFSVSVLFCLSASAQTVDELFKKSTEARGAIDKFAAAKTITMKARMTLQGMAIPVTIQVKRPNSLRSEMMLQGMTVVTAYDGQTAWMLSPMTSGPEKVPEERIKPLLDQVNGLSDMPADYKAKGYTFELIGKEDVAGTSAYKLKLATKDGKVSYMYLNSQNFLPLKFSTTQSILGMDAEAETFFSDYKLVDGMMMPHSIEVKTKGLPLTQSLTIDKIELNAPMDDSIFKMPTAKEK